MSKQEDRDLSQRMILPTTPIRLSLQAWLSLLVLGLVLWLAINNMGLIFETAGILFGAFLLSLAVSPAVAALARLRIPRGIATLMIYLALAAFVGLLGGLLVPMISAEISKLQESGPAMAKLLSTYLSQTPILKQLLPSSTAVIQALTQRLGTVATSLFTTVASIGDLAVDLIIVMLLAYFMVVESSFEDHLIISKLPTQYKERVRTVVQNARDDLAQWVRAQPIIMIYFMVVFSLSLALLKVPFAITIGLVGGLLGIIPFVGGVIALILAALSALTVDPTLVLWVTLIFTALVEIEAHILAPALYGRVTGLHPSVVVIAMLIGFKAGGLVGLIYSIPLTVIGSVLLSEVQSGLATDAKDQSA